MSPPFVNVTIPVFNEEKVLTENVGKVVEYLKSRCTFPYEIVIANNGSTDRTPAIAEALSHQYPVVRTVTLPESGRGRALRKVWIESAADILSYMDADLATDLDAFPVLIESVNGGEFDIATGSRRIAGSVTQRNWKRDWLSRIYHLLLRRMLQTRIADVQCGFKAITRKAANKLLPMTEDDGWLMDAELLAFGERLGYRIRQVPVRWVESEDSRVRIGSAALGSLKGLVRLRRRLRTQPNDPKVS